MAANLAERRCPACRKAGQSQPWCETGEKNRKSSYHILLEQHGNERCFRCAVEPFGLDDRRDILPKFHFKGVSQNFFVADPSSREDTKCLAAGTPSPFKTYTAMAGEGRRACVGRDRETCIARG